MSLLKAIQNQPEYELFRRFYAERKAPLVIVCGSGLSAPAGLPTWPRLRQDLEAAASAKASSLSQMGEQLLTPKLKTAKREKDPWVAFKLLKEILSPNVFNALVEEKLTPTIDQEPPDSYASLLRLQPKGFVTLNLDRFAGEALATANPGRPVTPIYGKQIAQKWNFIRSAKTFLVYLHGDLNDSSTWVLTHDDLSESLNSEGHGFFLKSLYLDYLVLFVGVSADDIALSRRLLEINVSGFNPKKLFWLTTRLDPDTTRWADDNNVALIRYVAKTGNEHQKIIQDLVEDCINYIALDNPRPNPTSTHLTFDDVSATTDSADLSTGTTRNYSKVVDSTTTDTIGCR